MKNRKNWRFWFILVAVLAVVLYVSRANTTDTADGGAENAAEVLTQEGTENVAEVLTQGGAENAAEVLTQGETTEPGAPESGESAPDLLNPDGVYTSCEDVALYLETYGRLPGNFITKKEAQELGWDGGSLEPYASGKCIGGDKFGNYEGLLPKENGRVYYECDIDTLGMKSRGAKRIVYSNDGLIYYTEDHYESFTLLYE